MGKGVDRLALKQAATQSCTVENITIMRGEVMKLYDLRRMIQANIRETESAKSESNIVNAVLFGLQVVKATCDVVIGVAGEVYVPAKGIATVYSGVQPSATLLGKGMSGQAISGQDVGKALNAGVTAGVKKGLGVDSPFQNLVGLNKIKTDLLIDASAQDMDSVYKDVAAYAVSLSSWAAKEAGAKAAGKVIKVGSEVAKAGVAFYAAYDDWKKNDMDANFDGIIASSKKQLNLISGQISELEKALMKCAGDGSFSPSTIKLLTNPPKGPMWRQG